MSIFKNRTVIGVICILLALVICFGITPLFNRGSVRRQRSSASQRTFTPVNSSPRIWSPRPRSVPTISPLAL